jgi:DNA-binding NtrC family response regulator
VEFVAKRKILVVDDEVAMLQAIARTFRSAGYVVEMAENGQQCLDLYRAGPADLVLMDLYMPEKDGLEALVELRKEFPKAVVVVMSGNRMSDLMLKSAEGMGAIRSIEKPFTSEALLTLVAEELKRVGGV